jgi:uncharacterized protein (TIGR03435 family)
MQRASMVFGLTILFLFSSEGSRGQTPAATPEFDASSVRVNHSGANGPETVVITTPRGNTAPTEVLIYANGDVSRETAFTPSGAVTLRYVTMRQLITQAYLSEITRDEYLMGGPGWLDSDRFDLIAKAPPGATIDTERLMIQAVLTARFHLALHREQKPVPVYALTIGKRGLKLQAAAGSGTPGCKGAADVVCTNTTITELANQLPPLALGNIDKPVIDRTGIKGAYDFRFAWTVPRPGPDVPRTASPDEQIDGRKAVFDALDQQLGLKVEEQRQPMPVVVIDHVDRLPTEN